MQKNLNSFLSALEQEGELIRIDARVSTDLEITELTDRQARSAGGGKALLFTNCGYDFPVVTNMMGSMSRITKALGVENLEELTGAVDAITGEMMRPRSSFMEKLRLLPSLMQVGGIFPKSVSGRGECQEVIYQGDEASLDILPILKCWPHDGGRFITLPLVTTVDPDSRVQNLGMYRMQIFSDKTAGLHWHLHKTGERHWRRYKELGIKRMPISIVLGGDPVYTYSATAPLPDGINEYMLAGFIRKRPVRLVKSITSDLRVPSDADIIIEGYVDTTQEKVIEGPFGDHTGFYSLEDLYPVMHVTAVTHRRGAIYPATIVGVPPQEDTYFAAATERIFLSPIRTVIAPEIRDMWLPDEGVAHNITIVDITKSYEGQAYKVASSMWGAGQMMFNKFIIVTAKGGDIRDIKALCSALGGIDISSDIFLSKGPADILDHSGQEFGLGGKLAIDATSAKDENRLAMQLSGMISMPRGVENYSLAAAKYGLPLLILYIDRKRDYIDAIEDFMQSNSISGVKYIVAMDRELIECDLSRHVWYAAANIDPMRDCHIEDNILYLDGRAKHLGQNGFNRRWPNVVVMDDQTIAEIDSRWSELMGDQPFITSPSLSYKGLILSDGAAYQQD